MKKLTLQACTYPALIFVKVLPPDKKGAEKTTKTTTQQDQNSKKKKMMKVSISVGIISLNEKTNT